MVVDIVINWAADGIAGADDNYVYPPAEGDRAKNGLVLCFLHAHVCFSTRIHLTWLISDTQMDVDTPQDNDPNAKSGWTNWCGTPRYNGNDIQSTYQQLLFASPSINGAPEDQPSPDRVLQIMSVAPARKLLLTWPTSATRIFSSTFSSPTSSHKSSLAETLASLVKLVDVKADTDAKTNCMRRFKARSTICVPSDIFDKSGKQNLKKSKKADEGLEVPVDSLFIPHGESELHFLPL
jgi:hypothetical protein